MYARGTMMILIWSSLLQWLMGKMAMETDNYTILSPAHQEENILATKASEKRE